MQEIWKDISGYEGIYQISNLGRVKSIARKTKNQYGDVNRILKIKIEKNGYARIGLFKDKKQKFFEVHRLVAQAFIPNTNHYPHVNHKDENKLNNNVENLEWCTPNYNNNYGIRTLKSSITKQKKIAQYDLKGNLIKIWNSQKEAIEKLKISNHITDVCNNTRKTCGGYKWKFWKGELV